MSRNTRLVMNMHEAQVLARFLAGIIPVEPIDIEALADVTLRHEKNLTKHHAAIQWENRKDELLAEIRHGQLGTIRQEPTHSLVMQTQEEIEAELRNASIRAGFDPDITP